ncbi:MAG: PAS domain-containing protein [Rhizomicrobium sp.]
MINEHVGTSDIRDHYLSLEAPTHPKALRLMEFWKANAAKGIVVGRDVPSRAISELLSSIAIFEPVDGGSDYRARLAGESVRRRFSRDITGKLLSDLFAAEDFQDHLNDNNAHILSGTPQILDSRLTNGAVEQMHLEVVILPVLAPDRASKWLLVGLFYFS